MAEDDMKTASASVSEDQVAIEPLGLEWTQLLEASWKFSDEFTHKMLQTLIRLQRVFGVFVASSREPVSWMVLDR